MSGVALGSPGRVERAIATAYFTSDGGRDAAHQVLEREHFLAVSTGWITASVSVVVHDTMRSSSSMDG